jgi:hypothetical protein
VDNSTGEYLVGKSFSKKDIARKTGLLFPIGECYPLDESLVVSNSLDLNTLSVG